MASKIEIIKGAIIFTGSTFVSRIFGYIRDLLIAKYFGATNQTDAFFVALRIPNTLRELLGENTIYPAFVPFLFELENNKSEFKKFIDSAFSTILVISLLLVTFGIVFTPVLVRIMAPGLAKNRETLELTILLTRISFLYILFLSLTIIQGSILYYKKNFFYFSFSPVLMNIAVIVLTLLSDRFSIPIIAPTVGLVVGGLLQFTFICYGTARYKILALPTRKPFEGKTKEATKLMVPAAIGTATYHLNIFVDTFLASLIGEASISILYYANRIFLLPLSLFAVSLGNVLLPHASEMVAKNEKEVLTNRVRFSIFLVLLVNIPITAFIVLEAKEIIDILFRRGAFSYYLVGPVSLTLIMYSIGLPVYSIQKILISVHQAHKDTTTPRKSAFISIVSNFILGIILINFLKQAGIALATSISAVLQVVYLSKKLKEKSLNIKYMIPENKAFISITLGTLLPAIVLEITKLSLYYDPCKSFKERLFVFVAHSLSFTTTYLIILILTLKKQRHL